MADIQINRIYSPAEATRGSWAPIDSSTFSESLTSASRGRYAQLNYIVGSEPGALNLALSGGNVILPVSSVNIDEPLTIEVPDTTVYETVTVPATGIATINFSPTVSLVEVYNNNTTISVYVGFNNVALNALSAQGLPLVPEAFYSIERSTPVMYIGNVDTSSSVDVRIVGHYKS